MGAKIIVLGNFGPVQLYRGVAGRMDDAENVGGGQLLRIITDEAGFGCQVDNCRGDGWVFEQLFFKGADAGGTMQTAYAKGQFAFRFRPDDTVAESLDESGNLLAKLTTAPCTPSRRARSFSIRAAQLAQDIPVIEMVALLMNCYLSLKSPRTKCPQVILMADAMGSASSMPQNPRVSPSAMTMMMVTSGFRFIASLKISGFMTYPSTK